MKRLIALTLVMIGTPSLGQPPAPALAPIDYRDDASWLCLPGRADSCAEPQPTVALEPNGYGPVTQASPAANPAIDCFYVYPTVSRDPGLNSDMTPGIEEQSAVAAQFARFAGVCRTFAPIYRSATIRAIGVMLAGQDPQPIFDIAYADIVGAWRDFLRDRNRGRPFVLIGHSQGAIHLTRLLAEEIEGRPEATRMLSALLIGYNVEVPEGQLTGGSFHTTSLCTRRGQTGCVVSYVSFRASAPPPENSLFGRASRPGHTVACTNPAALGSAANAPLDPVWLSQSSPSLSINVTWSRAGPPPASFLRTPGLVSAACVNQGRVGYLAVTVNADPADARTDDIPGDVRLFGAIAPNWGLHPVDVNLAVGDLIRVVEAQARSYRRRR